MHRLTADMLPAEALRPLSLALGPAPDRRADAGVSTEAAPDPLEALRMEVREQARQEGLQAARAELEAELARREEATRKRLVEEHAAAQAELEARTAAMEAAAHELGQAVERHRRECEQLVVEAAYLGLTRVLGAHIGNGLVEALCRQALSELRVQKAVLRLSVDDAARLGGLQPEVPGLRIVADPALADGQCVLESERGCVDTGLDVRLEGIRKAFLAALSSREDDR